ncbi:response regulator [Photobacterium carnosum]|uniref:response regulator n=1 Tax=Photobacterium carnosum TaxID=2023717 RepID=UPI001C915122|nr:response regulator [Photobacterium carnosum]MBY3790300.1 response regulator [Photobacterium carnosum]MCD9535291.1 response regulator [Photobacterium carnosum]
MINNINILICDDSVLVHKSITRLLQSCSNATFFYAENGKEGLDCLKNSDIDIMFLDLTMPVMDGFSVMKSLPVREYNTTIIVLSADVQLTAVERSLALGADYFLSKPFNHDELIELSQRLGLIFDRTQLPLLDSHLDNNPIESIRELANIALGRGAAIISDHLGDFIKMPLPNVAFMTSSDLSMAITDVRNDHGLIAITQRFVGGGIHGEALVELHGDDIYLFGEKLGFSQTDEYKNEVIIDIANLMVSSFLVALSEQISIPFSVRQPIVLEEYMNSHSTDCEMQTFFTIEYTYKAEILDVECEVLFIMDSHSLAIMNNKVMESLN